MQFLMATRFTVLWTIFLLLASCGGDATAPGNDDPTDDMSDLDPGAMKMKVNGSDWIPGQVEGAVLVPNTVVSMTASIGNLASGLLLVITDVEGVAVRSYPLAAESGSGLARFFVGGYSQAVSSDSLFVAEPDSANPQGTLTVSEIDFDQKFISGSFSLDMVIDDGSGRLVRITEGLFNRISFGG